MTKRPLQQERLGRQLARLSVCAIVIGAFGTFALAPAATAATRHEQRTSRDHHAASRKPKTRPKVVDTVKLVVHQGLGKILVDSAGKTVYIFSGDSANHATCTGRCASIWPPVTIPKGAKPRGGPGVNHLGTIKSGKRLQVTWYKHPLYTYTLDTGPGMVNGNGVKQGSNTWFVATLARVTAKKPPTMETTTTSGSTTMPPGGYGY
jgi:predicted lipoprotein with Yx(FWY)xxD motif